MLWVQLRNERNIQIPVLRGWPFLAAESASLNLAVTLSD